MDKMLDFMLCGGMVALEIIGALIIAILIQGLVYWATGFSIHKHIKKLERRLYK